MKMLPTVWFQDSHKGHLLKHIIDTYHHRERVEVSLTARNTSAVSSGSLDWTTSFAISPVYNRLNFSASFAWLRVSRKILVNHLGSITLQHGFVFPRVVKVFPSFPFHKELFRVVIVFQQSFYFILFLIINQVRRWIHIVAFIVFIIRFSCVADINISLCAVLISARCCFNTCCPLSLCTCTSRL